MENRFTSLYADFVQFISLERRYSPHTVKAYTHDLEHFASFLEETYAEVSLERVTPEAIRSWMAGMKAAGVTTRSINRKLSTLRSWGKYLMKQGHISSDPARRIPAPRSGKRLPEFVERVSMDRLSGEREIYHDDFEGRLHRLIMDLLYETGMRRSELAGLTVPGVDMAAATLRVTGKGGKQRIIPISGELCRRLEGFIEEKKGIPGADTHFLLVTPGGRRLYPEYVYRTVKRYLSLVTTLQKKSPHVLRHTFATHLVNNGADLNAVKELLGHASLAATQVYTHNTIEQLKAVHSQAHPRSGK